MKGIIRCICGREHKLKIQGGTSKRCSCGATVEIKGGRSPFGGPSAYPAYPNVVVDDYQKQIREGKVRFGKPKFLGWCK